MRRVLFLSRAMDGSEQLHISVGYYHSDTGGVSVLDYATQLPARPDFSVRLN